MPEGEGANPKIAKHPDVSIKTNTDLNTKKNNEKHTMTKVEENNKHKNVHEHKKVLLEAQSQASNRMMFAKSMMSNISYTNNF